MYAWVNGLKLLYISAISQFNWKCIDFSMLDYLTIVWRCLTTIYKPLTVVGFNIIAWFVKPILRLYKCIMCTSSGNYVTTDWQYKSVWTNKGFLKTFNSRKHTLKNNIFDFIDTVLFLKIPQSIYNVSVVFLIYFV